MLGSTAMGKLTEHLLLDRFYYFHPAAYEINFATGCIPLHQGAYATTFFMAHDNDALDIQGFHGKLYGRADALLVPQFIAGWHQVGDISDHENVTRVAVKQQGWIYPGITTAYQQGAGVLPVVQSFIQGFSTRKILALKTLKTFYELVDVSNFHMTSPFLLLPPLSAPRLRHETDYLMWLGCKLMAFRLEFYCLTYQGIQPGVIDTGTQMRPQCQFFILSQAHIQSAID